MGFLCFAKFCSILLIFALFVMSKIQHLREKVALFAVKKLIYVEQWYCLLNLNFKLKSSIALSSNLKFTPNKCVALSLKMAFCFLLGLIFALLLWVNLKLAWQIQILC